MAAAASRLSKASWVVSPGPSVGGSPQAFMAVFFFLVPGVSVRAGVRQFADYLVVLTLPPAAGEQVKECAGVAGVQCHHRAAVTIAGDSVDPGGTQRYGDGFRVNRHAVSSGLQVPDRLTADAARFGLRVFFRRGE